MRKSVLSLLGIMLLGSHDAPHLQACGPFMPERWLDNGGIASDMSPEFFWALEVRRMARDFTPPEKQILPAKPVIHVTPDSFVDPATAYLTRQADIAEFDDAIKTGRIKPLDPTQAKEAHKLTRDGIPNHISAPGEFPSEFADYHRGALAFQTSDDGTARAAWEALLQRPEAERHYRSVWAAFMLGKLALAKEDPSAVQWFQKARELARAGFADATGLAADSYGWEARSELYQGHYEAAAKLYLTQLALGDESAIDSLKVVAAGGPEDDSENTPAGPDTGKGVAEKETQASQEQKFDAECAHSSLLRRIVTARILAAETGPDFWPAARDAQAQQQPDGCEEWLGKLEKMGLHHVDDADQLGWVAYTAGRYKQAARWLSMADPRTPTALWLKAKLERREGKLAQATASMAAAFRKIKADAIAFPKDYDGFTNEQIFLTPQQSAGGDLAGLHLTRGDFVNAVDAFLQADLWEDAAFVADRILTVDELKKYVDTHYPRPTPEKEKRDFFDHEDNATGVRWLLARRLVRAHRPEEATPYFKREEKAVLARYVVALKESTDAKKPKLQRAKALFTVAWITRHSGMELMGTEVEPDGFATGGEYPAGFRDIERLENVRFKQREDNFELFKKIPARLSIPASPAEKQRLARTAPYPSRRFHYRWVAADLAWRAAALLPDGTEELADVLNTGGSWIKDADDKGADKFIQAMEKRCPETEIGKAESAKHWFVDRRGPWSSDLEHADTQPDPGSAQSQ